MRAIALLIMLLGFSISTSAQEHLRYFGYWANNDYQAENHARTNITWVWTGDDNYQWDSTILSELAQAKSYGNKAIVLVESYVFDAPGGGVHRIDPYASIKFAALVDQLIAHGYLVPNNPEASTVAAFYPIDEPELNGLKDQNGQAHPALVNAVNVIRGNPNTSNFPLAVIGSIKYGEAMQGIRLFDWAGLDHYGASDLIYLYEFERFTGRLRPEQRTILVPQAAKNVNGDDSYHNPEIMFAHARSDGRVIVLAPFLWGQSQMTGTRSIPALRDAYNSIGATIKYGLSAQFVGMSVPTSMVSGQNYPVSVSFKNNGAGIWLPGTSIGLGSQNPGDNTRWGMHRVALPVAVYPQQVVTFSFTVRAPTSGNHAFQWRMVADGLAWFGDLTPSQTVSVSIAPTGSISANPNPCPIYAGQSTCYSSISWNSNRSDAEVWVSAPDGSGAQLFSRAQRHTQGASWITTNITRFALKAAGITIAYVDVKGEHSNYVPPEEPPPSCGPPECQIP
jgi:hypothetical protein